MKQDWSLLELTQHFTLTPAEFELIGNKTGPTRPGFAALLKFFLHEARFPEAKNEIPRVILAHLAPQVDVGAEDYLRYDWRGRAIKYHRTQIRKFAGYREPTVQDLEEVTAWLTTQSAHKLAGEDELLAVVYNRFRDIKVEPATPDRLERLVRSVMHTFEENFFTELARKIPAATKIELDALVGIFAPAPIEPEPALACPVQIESAELKPGSKRKNLLTLMSDA